MTHTASTKPKTGPRCPGAAESVPPISDSEVTCGPTTRLATLSSSATSSSNSTDFSSSSSSSSRSYDKTDETRCDIQILIPSVANVALRLRPRATFSTSGPSYLDVGLTTVHHSYNVVNGDSVIVFQHRLTCVNFS